MKWAAGPVTVRVPATSANLGPGFDSFGLALALYDTVEARATSGGLSISVTGIGAESAGAGEQHLVIRAMRAAFARLGGQPPGLALSCHNEIPQGFGLGSSAAAIVAGLLAARALAGAGWLAALDPALPFLGTPDTMPPDLAVLSYRSVLSENAVLGLASEIEGHPDNVAACLAGGLTIAWVPGPAAGDGITGSGSSGPGSSGSSSTMPSSAEPSSAGSSSAGPSSAGPRLARLSPLPSITPVLCVPAAALPTVTARQVLPSQVPHAAAAANSARAALLVTALTSQPDLLMDATEDFLHQGYRAASMPDSAGLIAALRAAGMPAVVSGAGPAVLALGVDDAGDPDAAGEIVAAIARAQDAAWQVRTLRIDTVGATVASGPAPSGPAPSGPAVTS